MNYPLSLITSTLALLAAACGPGTNNSDTGSDTTADTTANTNAESTADTNTDTTAGTTAPTTTDATSNSSSATGSSGDPTATTATTGDPVCPDVFPMDGTPCDAEGLTCGGPCEDPCAFCNVIRCEQGTWTGLEVFPADCLDCDAACTFVVSAACPAGPPDQAACVTGCMAVQAGDCGLLYNQALACMGSMPTFTCNPAGQPSVDACAAQFDALYACLG